MIEEHMLFWIVIANVLAFKWAVLIAIIVVAVILNRE